MITKIYPENPNEKTVKEIVTLLENDGVIVYPTDSVYAFGCSIASPKAIERIRRIKGKEHNLSIICNDLSTIADYARVDTPTFKLLKRNLPGPFTFILRASGKVPHKIFEKRKNIGIRIPSNPIPIALISALGGPLLSTSVKTDDEFTEYITDPELIDERFGTTVDRVIDGGYGKLSPSTVVDCSNDEPIIVRQGIGVLIL